eukprot:PhM_4_TR18633/c1_g1_i1/m.80015
MSKFFSSTTRGEAGEIKEDLTSDDRARQKNGLMRVIAGMTVGRDMSSVFTDVTQLMATPAIDIKKLVYLYLMQYATVMPDKAVLVAGPFVKDTLHESPLIRGLALRTMSSIPVDKMTEFLMDPLRRSLRDESDPYVKRCAALAVLKLHHTSRVRCEDNNLLPLLMDQFNAGNSAVVANAAAAVNELRTVRGSDNGLEINGRIASTLQNALNECNEWGQVYVLEALAAYVAPDREEAEMIIERILPWLQHGNAAVVMASVKIIVNYIEQWCSTNAPGSAAQKEERYRKYGAKLAPALVSLVSTTHDVEIRFIALRNINLIVQRFPDILLGHLRVFFVKYNDPIYVKLEKLEILMMLAAKANVEQLLGEFVEYAQEVDVEFVRKSVRAIGMLALKIEVAAPECVQQLVSLIRTKVNYVVQEAVVVIRDIFRRYPNKYESIIAVLCENLETLDEPEAKASMIWIVGEYADRIENAVELLEIFMDNFEEETMVVRLAVLQAVVKLYLKRGAEAEQLLQLVLQQCTDGDIPDLRDRAFLYWRLLTTEAEAASAAIFGEHEPISTDASTKYDKQLLTMMLQYLGTLSSVYHKPPRSLFGGDGKSSIRSMLGALVIEEDDDDDDDTTEVPTTAAPSQSSTTTAAASQPAAAAPAAAPAAAQKAVSILDDDIFGVQVPTTAAPAPAAPTPTPTPAAPAAPKAASLDDFFGGGGGSPAAPAVVQKQSVLAASQGNGVAVSAAFSVVDGTVYLEMDFTNSGAQPATGFMFQLNKTVYGITLAEPINVPTVNPGAGAVFTRTRMAFGGPVADSADMGNTVQVAMRCSAGTFYFNLTLQLTQLLTTGACGQQEYSQMWSSLPESATRRVRLPPSSSSLSRGQIQNTMSQANKFSFVGERQGQLYFSSRLLNGQQVLVEVAYDAMTGAPGATIKATDAILLVAAERALCALA